MPTYNIRQIDIKDSAEKQCQDTDIMPAYQAGWITDEIVMVPDGQEYEISKLARTGDYVELGKIFARAIQRGEWNWHRKQFLDETGHEMEHYVDAFDYPDLFNWMEGK